MNKLNFENMQCSFDQTMFAIEQNISAHVKRQCHGWQLGFDSRLKALEECAQKDANNAVRFEDRVAAVEDCVASLLELFALKHQQSLDLNDEVAKIKTMVFDLEESLGRNLPEAVHPHNVEQKKHSNKLTAIPEHGNPLLHERVGSIASTHKQMRLRQQGPDPKQELANSKGSFANRLCVVECDIDQLSSILKNIETRLSSMNGQVPASNRTGIACCRSTQKSTDSSTMTFSGEAFESSVSQDALSIVCNHHSAFSKEPARVSEHLRQPVPAGITDWPHHEDANAQGGHGHSQMQLMLAKAKKCLEQVMPLNEGHLSRKYSTSDTAAQMLTN